MRSAVTSEFNLVNCDFVNFTGQGGRKSEDRGQRSEDEARDTARRAYNKNPALTSSDIGKAIGRARRTVDSYIADLRAATQMGMESRYFA